MDEWGTREGYICAWQLEIVIASLHKGKDSSGEYN